MLTIVGAEGERRSAENDANQHQRERDVKHGAEPGVHRRKAGEGEHDGQNQPDVVRLPNRTDRVGDDLPLAMASRSRREEIPDAAAEVGASEKDVRVQRKRQNGGQHHGQAELRHGARRGACTPGSIRSPWDCG
jgi:hypothetical protein